LNKLQEGSKNRTVKRKNAKIIPVNKLSNVVLFTTQYERSSSQYCS